MDDCLFCKIANGEIDSEIVAENASAVAFRDVNPQAPVHILVVPREHIASLQQLDEGKCGVMADIFELVNEIAVSEGVAQSGYRVVVNTGEEAGQDIDHLHLHLLGGRFMKWPPG